MAYKTRAELAEESKCYEKTLEKVFDVIDGFLSSDTGDNEDDREVGDYLLDDDDDGQSSDVLERLHGTVADVLGIQLYDEDEDDDEGDDEGDEGLSL